MPQLIRNIQGEAYLVTTGTVYGFKSITGQIQQEDYINLNGFIAYLQNFTKVEDTELLIKPPLFGLINRYNIPVVTLEINY
jgi:hypothetical protein